MKLQKQKSDYTRGYHKFVVVIPNEIVEQSGLKEGEELKAEVKKGEIKLRRK
ncbi:MAG: AbrB/MazE/SpoVT family DNA-binding domain-containing protein [Candidatus Pacearchaeota archaeon]